MFRLKKSVGTFYNRFEEGQITLLLGLVKDKILSITEAAKRLNISESEFQKRMSEQ